jgi:hypothetical protein
MQYRARASDERSTSSFVRHNVPGVALPGVAIGNFLAPPLFGVWNSAYLSQALDEVTQNCDG